MRKGILIKRGIVLVVLVLLVCTQAFTRDSINVDRKASYQRLDISYIFGAQFYNDNFLYNPGYSAQLTYGFKVSKDVGIGLGTGYTALTKERFIPIYLEAFGQKKNKKNAPFVKAQAGYSIGWNSSTAANSNYEMKGGGYFSAGIGRKIALNDDYALLFNWAYTHQFAKMNYNVFEGRKYSEPLNYDMIWITIGLLLNN